MDGPRSAGCRVMSGGPGAPLSAEPRVDVDHHRAPSTAARSARTAVARVADSCQLVASVVVLTDLRVSPASSRTESFILLEPFASKWRSKTAPFITSP